MSKHTVKINRRKLRSAIRAKHWRVSYMAKKVEVKQQTFRSYLKGDVDMPFMLIEKCAEVLDIEPEDLVDDGATLEHQYRDTLLSFVNYKEMSNLMGECSDMELLQVYKMSNPYFLPKKVAVSTSHDAVHESEQIARNLSAAKGDVEYPPDTDPGTVEVFNIMAGVDDE